MYGHMGSRTGGIITSAQIPNPLLLANGTAGAPALAFTNDPGIGLRRVSAGVGELQFNSTVGLTFDGATPSAGPRSYIVDALNTKAVMTLTRGTSTSDGNVPDTTYTSAFAVTSFDAGDSTDYVAESIKGFVYAVEGAGGMHIAISGVGETPAAGSWTASGTHGVIGVFGQASGHKASTRTWGGNLIAKQITGASATMTGLEVGVESQVAPTNRYGIQVVTLSDGAAAGTGEDIGMKFVNKNSTAANRWADAVIAFNSPDDAAGDGWPAASTAALIKAYAPVSVTAAKGIDFEGVAFGTAAIVSTGFMVNGAGRLGVRVAGVDGTAPLRMDANGDSFNIVIDNPVLAGGAGGGADRFLVLKLGTETVIFPGKVQ